MRLGCQTYTWEMLGDGWTGGPDDLLRAIAQAGYAGIEITDRMIGHYADDPAAFAAALDRHGLALVALACASPSGFTETSAFASDLAMVGRWLGYLGRFPGAVLSMGSATVMSPGTRDGKFDVAARVYNEAARLGAAAGVPVAVHPSSHHDTLLFDRDDYEALMRRLDPEVGWVPDTGHILRGGMDLPGTLAAHRARIRYVHLKDVDGAGRWAMMGTGICDIAGVAAAVRDAPRFSGWIVAEEESEEAGRDPGAAVRRNRDTLRRLLHGA
jgi:inosose dehydratase